MDLCRDELQVFVILVQKSVLIKTKYMSLNLVEGTYINEMFFTSGECTKEI